MSFPQFALLPVEVQNLIWDLCIPQIPPTAYMVTIRRERDRAPRGKSHLYLDNTFTLGSSPHLAYAAHKKSIKTLRATCSQAAGAIRGRGQISEPVVIQLRVERDDLSPHHANATRAFWAAAVNAARMVRRFSRSRIGSPRQNEHSQPSPILVDPKGHVLFIRNFWDDVTFHFFDSYNGPVPRYIAAPWNTEAITRQQQVDQVIMLAGPVLMWVEVFYIYVEPEQLRDDSHAIWLEMFDWDDSNYRSFLSYYENGSRSPGPFTHGDWEYYEVSLESLSGLTGYVALLSRLEHLYRLRMDKLFSDPSEYGCRKTSFRIMSRREL